jgi:mono/diheme cytochrome c family protein
MKLRILALALAVFTALNTWATPPLEEGKSLFTARCAGCHNVHKTLTGPALAGVDQRHSIEWIINFVHGSQAMVKKGDKAAVALFNQFKIPMPDHPDLTADNIKNIVAYIKAEAATPAAAEKKADATTPEKPSFDYIGFSSHNYGLLLTYAGLLTLLIGSALFLVQVKALRRRMAQEQV